MMTPRTRRNLIIGGSVVLLLLFLWLLTFLLPKKQPMTPAPVPSVPTETASPLNNEQLEREQQVRIEHAGLNTVVKVFVERYGSFSNEANFQNIRDVYPMMTQTYAQATETNLANKQAPAEFYGVTTRVVSIQVLAQDEDEKSASVRVSTQRREEQGSAQNVSTKYQDIDLELVQQEGVWLVQSATWR